MELMWRNAIFLVIFVCSILVVGFVMYQIGIDRLGNNCSENYHYINPQLDCDYKLKISKKGYAQLKIRLQEFISQKTSAKEVVQVSIYFRDLQNGPTLGIDEYEKFVPASLLKLPVLLTYLNLEEESPGFLKTEVIYNKGPDELFPPQVFAPSEVLEDGASYSLDELLIHMIKYSDNRTDYFLFEYLDKISPDKNLILQTYVDLGIIDPQSSTDETISVKSYASVLVQLYHSSYFNKKESSERVLSLLVDTDWESGIIAGVPTDIKVANKFGERTGLEGGIQQLHDCGIIYYPENPYLLCIMTRGNDINKLPPIISAISKMVYEEFDSRKIK